MTLIAHDVVRDLLNDAARYGIDFSEAEADAVLGEVQSVLHPPLPEARYAGEAVGQTKRRVPVARYAVNMHREAEELLAGVEGERWHEQFFYHALKRTRSLDDSLDLLLHVYEEYPGRYFESETATGERRIPEARYAGWVEPPPPVPGTSAPRPLPAARGFAEPPGSPDTAATPPTFDISTEIRRLRGLGVPHPVAVGVAFRNRDRHTQGLPPITPAVAEQALVPTTFAQTQHQPGSLEKQARPLSAAEVLRPKHSYGVQARINPPRIQGTGDRGEVTVGDVGRHLEQQTLHRHGGPLDLTDPADMKKAVAAGFEDASYQLHQPRTGENWYGDDVAHAFRLTARLVPELKRDKGLRQFMTAVAAVMSSATRAGQNWSNAGEAIRHYVRTGELPTRNPANGALWSGQTGNNQAQALGLLNFLAKKMGGHQQAAKWLLASHPVAELKRMKLESGLYKTADIPGFNEMQRPGFFIFGAKIGAFGLNLNGQRETTVDRWHVRAANRHRGTITTHGRVTPDTGLVDTPRDEYDRARIKEWTRRIADKLGKPEQAAQAILWYFEQQLYHQLGAKAARSESFSDGARQLLRRNGLPEE